jgi:hypothetical protein
VTQLAEILGKNIASPEAKAALARYPALHADEDDQDPDEGQGIHYLRSEADGLLLKLGAEGEILAIFLMSEGKDGFSQFRGPLPGNLTFESLPGDALKTFGAPAYNRPGGRVGQFQHGELFRFDWPGHSLHLQFRAARGGVDLVTLMVASAVPGRSVKQE